MDQITATPQRLIRDCSCGTKFVPPAIATRAKRCRKCHMAFRQKEAVHAAAIRACSARKDEQVLVLNALRESFLKNELPKSATVRRNGRQIVVCWMGRSTTFYTN